MFGYIAPRMDQMTETQKMRYRSFYCGICREIGSLSGKTGRLLLSHDMTFLAILLNSLMEPSEGEKKTRCGLHPARSREIICCEPVRYAAGMNILLMDLKCEDQIRDDHSRTGRLARKMLKAPAERLQKEYPSQYGRIRDALGALWQEEKKERPDPDRLCNLSGEMLGAAFTPSWADSYWMNALRRLGEGLGRFIYWMDAWDDLEEDRRKEHVNPLLLMEPGEDMDSFVRESLEMLIGEATGFFEMLPLEKDLDLMRNVLYSGVWQRYEIRQQRAGKERKNR